MAACGRTGCSHANGVEAKPRRPERAFVDQPCWGSSPACVRGPFAIDPCWYSQTLLREPAMPGYDYDDETFERIFRWIYSTAAMDPTG